MSNLELRDVSKKFGAIKALTQLSLQVTDGEFLILLGPTGAGKTTTLRCVAGLEKLDAGAVFMDGHSMQDITPAERDVAFVFQNYALYPRKTVFQNMAFPLEARRMAPKDIQKRIEQIATKLNIDMLLQRRPAQLSGGQQQRVALGRAMVRQPRLFLMDEPLTNLDFKLRVEMRTELKRLQRELNATFFYVTNDQVEAMSMADRIAVLNQGELQQVDTPETVYRQPANLFVAGFVGNPRMNFRDCYYDADTGTLYGKNNDWHLALSLQHRTAADVVLTAGKPAVFGVRAEEIELLHEAAPEALPAEVFVIEPLGDRLLVDVRQGDSTDTLKIKVSPFFPVQSGEKVWLRFNRFHVFDKASGMTIF
jgi:ABC-type sugar transport system ATPase subunit